MIWARKTHITEAGGSAFCIFLCTRLVLLKYLVRSKKEFELFKAYVSSPVERRRIERERERESFVHTVNIFWLWQLAVGHGFSLFLSCTVHMSSNVRTRKEERSTRPPLLASSFFDSGR